MRYRGSVSNLHLLYIRTCEHGPDLFIVLSSMIQEPTELVCIFLLIAIIEGNLHFHAYKSNYLSIYTHFIETCHQLEGHFRGLIR